jgi:hypothetical protein
MATRSTRSAASRKGSSSSGNGATASGGQGQQLARRQPRGLFGGSFFDEPLSLMRSPYDVFSEMEREMSRVMNNAFGSLNAMRHLGARDEDRVATAFGRIAMPVDVVEVSHLGPWKLIGSFVDWLVTGSTRFDPATIIPHVRLAASRPCRGPRRSPRRPP